MNHVQDARGRAKGRGEQGASFTCAKLEQLVTRLAANATLVQPFEQSSDPLVDLPAQYSRRSVFVQSIRLDSNLAVPAGQRSLTSSNFRLLTADVAAAADCL